MHNTIDRRRSPISKRITAYDLPPPPTAKGHKFPPPPATSTNCGTTIVPHYPFQPIININTRPGLSPPIMSLQHPISAHNECHRPEMSTIAGHILRLTTIRPSAYNLDLPPSAINHYRTAPATAYRHYQH